MAVNTWDNLDADGKPVSGTFTDEQAHADESVEWTLRALRDQQSQGLDITQTEPANIEKLFALAETLPTARRDYWLREFAASNIVRA